MKDWQRILQMQNGDLVREYYAWQVIQNLKASQGERKNR
jgi:hypothetical protein